jgi:hypothetical protein
MNKKRQTKWLVYQYSTKTYRWECIDEVYFTNDCTPEYVRNSLVNHDGYSYSIKVVQA